jgi:hypothetical protein
MVRALHLYLTGRPVPASPPDTRQQMVIETQRRQGAPRVPVAADPGAPCAFMLVRAGYGTVARIWRR